MSNVYKTSIKTAKEIHRLMSLIFLKEQQLTKENYISLLQGFNILSEAHHQSPNEFPVSLFRELIELPCYYQMQEAAKILQRESLPREQDGSPRCNVDEVVKDLWEILWKP